MTTPYHRIGRNAHRLPAGYFADAQNHTISAAPENPRRSEQSGAESGDASGESGAAVNLGAGRATVSANTTSTVHAAGSSHAPTPIISGVSSSPVREGMDAGSGYRVLGAGNLGDYEREQLHAARALKL